MAPLGPGPERALIERSILSTHAATHSQYTMAVEQVFALDRAAESDGFLDCGNRRLLFHGSRLSNWAGILGQGLRIAPPEAPATGYMLGKGVYFADMSSKAANYCFPSRSQPVGLVVVAEVALGEARELVAADPGAARLPAGRHSVAGQGRVEPAATEEVPGTGLSLPLGPPRETRWGQLLAGWNNACCSVANSAGYTLNYNEFIVYNTKQVKMKYLAKIKFNFK
jgi:poly [ADP-ribose] polymerase